MEDRIYHYKNWFHVLSVLAPRILIFRTIVMIASNMKHRCLACGYHFVDVPNILTQSNAEIVLKGIYFSISQTTLTTKPFYDFFYLLKTFTNPFLVMINTFLPFYRIFWTVSIFHGWKSFWITITLKGDVIKTMFGYWLIEYFFSPHFLHCRRRVFVIQTILVSCIPFVVGMWVFRLNRLDSGTAFATFG